MEREADRQNKIPNCTQDRFPPSSGRAIEQRGKEILKLSIFTNDIIITNASSCCTLTSRMDSDEQS